jgi:hypothetical protein
MASEAHEAWRREGGSVLGFLSNSYPGHPMLPVSTNGAILVDLRQSVSTVLPTLTRLESTSYSSFEPNGLVCSRDHVTGMMSSWVARTHLTMSGLESSAGTVRGLGKCAGCVRYDYTTVVPDCHGYMALDSLELRCILGDDSIGGPVSRIGQTCMR